MGKTSYRAGAFHDDGEAAEGEIRNTVTGTAMRKRLILRSRARNKRRQREANMINCNMQLGRMFMKNFVP